MSAAAPVTGPVSAANSLVGAATGDVIGSGGADILTTGNLLLRSPGFNGNVGALTFVNASGAPPVGVVSAANSLVGTPGNPIHNSGQYDIRQLADGGYIVVKQSYNAFGGMIVYGSASKRCFRHPGPANGWIGAPVTTSASTSRSCRATSLCSMRRMPRKARTHRPAGSSSQNRAGSAACRSTAPCSTATRAPIRRRR